MALRSDLTKEMRWQIQGDYGRMGQWTTRCIKHSNDGPLRELTQMVNEIEVRYQRQIQIGELYGDVYERGCCIPISKCYVV